MTILGFDRSERWILVGLVLIWGLKTYFTYNYSNLPIVSNKTLRKMVKMMHYPNIWFFLWLSPNFTSIYVIIIETCLLLFLAGKISSGNVFVFSDYHAWKVDYHVWKVDYHVWKVDWLSIDYQSSINQF